MRVLSKCLMFLLMLVTAGCTPPAPAPSPAPVSPLVTSPLETLTAAHTRVVWIRQVVSESNDPFAVGNHFVLMGLDARNGEEERVILDTVDNYRKPLLTADGERIVFTDLPELAIHVVNWDGSGQRRLGKGMGIELWQDPQTGTDWVYYAESYRTNDTLDGVGLMRMALDDPARTEPVWDQTHVTPDNFQLSADGTMAAGLFPWKRWSVLDLKAGTLSPQGKGCWTSMAPDNSYLCWVFDGAHKNILLKRPGEREVRQIPLNRAPGVEGHEVYHPRWSNHVRYMAMTGPYKVMGRYNAITGGGRGVNVYVGRFSEDMSSIEAWAQVTDDESVDIFPDVWVADANAAVTRLVEPPPEGGNSASAVETVRVVCRLVEITPTPSLEDISPYKSTLVDYAYDVVAVEEGVIDAERIIVRHWGIRDTELVELNQEVGSTVTLSLEAVDAHPWLMGERVSGTITDDFLYDVYLDVGQPRPAAAKD